MKIRYDFHIHSALSPCADDDMTPSNVVGFAKLNGLDAVAIADHNAIDNVEYAMQAGKEYGVVVVPALELQTEEDIHVLCLFPSLSQLQDFFSQITFPQIDNDASIFGNQLVVDCDDNVVTTQKRLLLVGAYVAVEKVHALAQRYGGVAIPAHVDRDENGMVAILGDVVEPFDVVELSSHATEQQVKQFCKTRKVVVDSDAHTLQDVGKANGVMQVEQLTAQAIVDALR